MKENSMSIASNLILPVALGLICAVIVYATLTGKSLPLISNPRSALIALLVVGMAACAGGIGQVGASGRWLSPLAILGYVLGLALLAVFVSAFAGWKLPIIQNEAQAATAAAILMAVKFLIGIPGYFFHWL